MVVWNANFEANPEDTDDISYGANEIRQLKEAIRERMNLEHSWEGNAQPFHNAGECSVCFIGNTAEIANLANVANGCIAWDTTLKSFKGYQGGNAWGRLDPIPSGSKMLFIANAAPAGWTLDANNNDKLIRVVSNAANGGTTGGSWTITGLDVDYSTYSEYQSGGASVGVITIANDGAVVSDGVWRPAYLNALICTKD